MAKKSSKPKKSRFGNPAKAATEKAANNVVSLSDAIVQRSLGKLMPAFIGWMDAAGVPADEIDRLSSILMNYFRNYFRNYSASVPAPVFTKLDVELTGKILEDAGRLHPEMRVSVALALNSYLKFLMTTHAWTGPQADLVELLGLTDEGIFAPSSQELASYIYHDGIDPVEAAEDRARRKYVRRAIALLEWIGGGRELTATGNIRRKDLAEAAACVDFSAVGSARTLEIPAGDAPRPVASMDRVPRLPEYWYALIDTKLIKVSDKKVELTRAGKAFLKAPARALNDSAALAYFLYYDAVIPHYGIGLQRTFSVRTARMLAAAASARPDVPVPDDPEHPIDPRGWQTSLAEHSVKELIDAGLVEGGKDITVPLSLRAALASALERFAEIWADNEG